MTRHRRCPTCHGHGTYTRRDTLVVCTCPAGLKVNLADLTGLTDDLETTLARQGATGGRVGARSAERLLPFDGNAGRALTELRRMLNGWVNELRVTSPHHGPRCAHGCLHESCAQVRRDEVPGRDVPSMAAWLLRMFPRLLVHPLIDELTADVARHVDAARRVIDRRPDRWYAGPCRTPGCTTVVDVRRTERPTDLYADVDARQVTCPRCRVSVDVREQRAWLLAQAEDRLATATECARALTSLGEPVTPERIRKWAERDRLAPRGSDGTDHPLYRVGDVIDLLAAHREKEARRAG